MIEIDLLSPQRSIEGPHRKGFSPQIALGVVIALVILSALGTAIFWQNQEYHASLKEKLAQEVALTQLREKTQDMHLLENTYSTLLTRTRFLEQQADQKFAPVILMDSISRSLNPLTLWLLRLGMSDKEVEIEGRSWQSEDIQEFLDRLEQTPDWGNLLGVEIRKESYRNNPVYHFALRFLLNRP